MRISKYENIYENLKECFYDAYGNGKESGLISISEVKRLSKIRRNDSRKNMKNSLIEVPQDNGLLYKTLEKTYISRDTDSVSGLIGCAEPVEQFDGITNIALLMYLSNQLAKNYKNKLDIEEDPMKRREFNREKKRYYQIKEEALKNLIATTYILSKTSDEYRDEFSYGNRIDDNGDSTFVIDLQYMGQLCVHYGSEDNKETIIKDAQDTVKTILEKKLELGQINNEQLQQILADLDRDGVLPEYEGKLCEYAGFPLDYMGEESKRCRRKIRGKTPENITSEDIKELENYGLNKREIYFLFIKMGARKPLLKAFASGCPIPKVRSNPNTDSHTNKVIMSSIVRNAVSKGVTNSKVEETKKNESNLSRNAQKNEKLI